MVKNESDQSSPHHTKTQDRASEGRLRRLRARWLSNRRVTWPPTDLQVLDAIYRRYYDAFVKTEGVSGPHATKNFVPIDAQSIADEFGVDPDIIFGRLYYSLEQRFGIKDKDGSSVPFFALEVGGDVRAIHFPMMAGILAELRAERRRFVTSMWLSIVAIIVSLVSLFIGLRS